jgi:hypothetical protein
MAPLLSMLLRTALQPRSLSKQLIYCAAGASRSDRGYGLSASTIRWAIHPYSSPSSSSENPHIRLINEVVLELDFSHLAV